MRAKTDEKPAAFELVPPAQQPEPKREQTAQAMTPKAPRKRQPMKQQALI